MSYIVRRNVQARKLGKAGFAVFFIVAVLGTVLLLISQVPLTGEYYEVVDTHSFSVGEPLTFPWTSEAGVKYRFEAKGVDWTSQPRYSHHLSLREDYLSSRDDEPAEPPWVWYVSVSKRAIPTTVNATFWHYEYDYQVIDRATTSTSVEISQSRETTYHPTYLVYVGLPLLITGAILTTIIGKDADSRIGFAVFQYGWARLRAKCTRAHAPTVGGLLIIVTALICLFLAVAWALLPQLGVLMFGVWLPGPMKLFLGGPGILAFALGCVAGTMSILKRHFILAMRCGAFSLIPAILVVSFTLVILNTGSKFVSRTGGSSISSISLYLLIGALAPAVVGLVLVAASMKEF